LIIIKYKARQLYLTLKKLAISKANKKLRSYIVVDNKIKNVRMREPS